MQRFCSPASPFDIVLTRTTNLSLVSTFNLRKMLLNHSLSPFQCFLLREPLPRFLLHLRPLRKPHFSLSIPTPIKSLPHKPIHIPILPHLSSKKICPYSILLQRHLLRHLLSIMFNILCCAPTCIDDM